MTTSDYVPVNFILMPNLKTAIISTTFCLLYLVANTLFMGFSLSTCIVTIALCLLFNFSVSVRGLLTAFLPIILFAVIYDFMRVYPNYMVNPIDTRGLYELEKTLFGISTPDGQIIPSEYFKHNHCALADILSGMFYLCWVPLPIAYGLYLYITRRRCLCLRFTTAFLLVNLIGFAGYYIHPAAPPWYVMDYGFVPDHAIGGQVAGFARFDEMTGLGVFHALYGKNSNVFAAVPSLHSAYVPVALFYALRTKPSKIWLTLLTTVSIGIWFSAVYSGHHYVIDVLLGITCTILALALFEGLLMRIPLAKRFFER